MYLMRVIFITLWKERKSRNFLTVHEYANAKESTLTSFYTPLNVIDNIYRILERMGFNQGRIIETSMGNGNFFDECQTICIQTQRCVVSSFRQYECNDKQIPL